ncbi:S41 family peptidase, partial [Candidatus Dependentiae bacterium]
TKTDPILKNNILIFILIDNFTASASEILAGCLRHYSDKSFEDKKAKKMMVFLLGTPTFGKGSVQEVIPISNGCALKLTTMLYYLPNQKSIQASGIEPDFLIKPKITPSDEIKWIKELYGKETSLKHHITENEVNINNETQEKEKEEKEKEKEEKEKNWEEKQIEAINKDVQIKSAINMINMLAFAKKCNPKKVNSRQNAINFLKQNYLTDEIFEVKKVA